MSSSATAQDVPPVSFSFSMLDMVVLYDAVSYIFMCRNKQFTVNVSTERLRGEGGLADTFYKFKEDDLNDPDVPKQRVRLGDSRSYSAVTLCR